MRKRLSVFFLLLMMGLVLIGPHPYLELHDFHRQKLLGVVPLQIQDQFQIEWIHSVELTPWRETYKVAGFSGMELAATSFQSYGAGVPVHFQDQQGVQVKVQDGWITVIGLHEKRDQVLYLITRDDYLLRAGGRTWKLADVVPLGSSLGLSVGWYPWWYRFTAGLNERGVTQG